MDIQGVILAAGLSSRAKTFKMTLEFRGKTVLENTIDNMLEHCSNIFVVGGYQIERLKPIIARYSRVELLYNQSFMDGMFSSVKKGIEAVSATRFFLTPGDYPMISGEVYQELLKYKAPVVIPSFKGCKGHPILAETITVKQAMKKNEPDSLRETIKGLEAMIVPVECRGVIQDIDTIEDYEMMQRQLKGEVSL